MSTLPQLTLITDLLPTDTLLVNHDGNPRQVSQETLGNYAGNLWAGKNFATFGDSITAPGTWQDELIVGYLKANMTLNGAVAGYHMNQVLTGYDADDLADIDVVIVAAGTNDFSNERVLGTFADAAGADSFYGDVKEVIETIFGWKPSLERLVFFAPLARGAESSVPSNMPNLNGDFLRDYNDVIIDCGRHYGVPVLDLLASGPVNHLNGEVYLQDGLHPTSAGSKLAIARPAKGFFRSL